MERFSGRAAAVHTADYSSLSLLDVSRTPPPPKFISTSNSKRPVHRDVSSPSQDAQSLSGVVSACVSVMAPTSADEKSFNGVSGPDIR
jgi:hypothetical protein